VDEFKKEVKKHFEQIRFPSGNEEEWRKFPLQQIQFDTLIRNEIDITQTEVKGQETQVLSDESTAKQMLHSLLESVKTNYFALYILLTCKDYFLFEFAADSHQENQFDARSHVPPDKNGLFVFLYSVKNEQQIRIREAFQSNSTSENLHLLGNISFYKIGNGAKLDVLYEEELDENLVQFRYSVSEQGRDSEFRIHSYPLGGFRKKHFYLPELNGSGGEFLLMGVSSVVKRELLDIDAKATHLASNTTSKIVYKAIVNDRAHHIFTGNLAIPNTVKKVSAHQESHNLSLNKKARAEANPKLEVMAEDVSCTHGATVGDIDENQLFYLLSRGLTLDESKSLLVSAFYEETVSKLPFSEPIKEEISEKLKKSVLRNV